MTTNSWQRSKTTRRYLHPPKSDRMFTLWAEGKIVFGENNRCVDHTSYKDLDCVVVVPAHTKHARPFDFHNTENRITESGAPIHSLTNGFGGFKVDLEAFCNVERRSSCFARIRVTNTAPYKASDKIGFVVRRGKEKELVFGSPDEYVSYDPEISTIKQAKNTFVYDDTTLRDGEYFVRFESTLPMSYDDMQGILFADLTLCAGETRDIFLCIGKGEDAVISYDSEKTFCENYWERELSRVNRLPEKLANDPDKCKMIKHLVAQILQCYCYLVDEDFLIQRQGGLQRLIWPWESKPLLEALGQIGDFGDYIEAVISFYFDMQQQKNGEVKGLGESWASISACALYTLATYARQKGDKEYWERYKDRAMLTFGWLSAKRRESEKQEGDIPGLFPSMRGCDWPHVLQHWTNTDCWVIFALESLVESMKLFDDANADTVEAELKDYKATILGIFDKFLKEAEGRDALRIPLTPHGNDKPLLDDFYPYLLQGSFAYLFLEGEDIKRAERWCERQGIIDREHMMHAHMPYRDGNTHIWYTSVGDSYWFKAYMKIGDRESARRTIESQIKYSMTDEYYMQERYCDNDPYYIPWSPNASASGRLILMLLEYYGEL